MTEGVNETEKVTRRQLHGSHRSDPPRKKGSKRKPTSWIDRVLGTISVLGELLVTAGVVVLLYVAWQMWWQDSEIKSQQNQIATQIMDDWASNAPSASAPASSANPSDVVVEMPAVDMVTKPSMTDVPVAPLVDEGKIWGVLHVPRFGNGTDWAKAIAQGTDMTTVLDKIGVGHYSETQLPGQLGNTVLASHRSGMGSSFYAIDKLQLGDQIVIETKAGWYTYVYRNTEYVLYTGTQILNPVPALSINATDSILTLQSCTPLPFSGNERIIAYAAFVSFTPRSAGEPAVLAALQ